jgi:hypothetical protein
MDVYHIWCSLKDDVGDLEFAAAVRGYLEHLKVAVWSPAIASPGASSVSAAAISLNGISPSILRILPRWITPLAAFRLAPIRQKVFTTRSIRRCRTVFFALYRDFPDPGRVTGQEKF